MTSLFSPSLAPASHRYLFGDTKVFQQAGYKRGEAAIRQAFAYIFAERHDMEPAVRESDLEVVMATHPMAKLKSILETFTTNFRRVGGRALRTSTGFLGTLLPSPPSCDPPPLALTTQPF